LFARALRSVNQTYGRIEIVVVDASEDAPDVTVSGLGCRAPRGGRAPGAMHRPIGGPQPDLAGANGPYVTVLDDDTPPRAVPAALSRL